jgi:phospholipid N-methyltransferase
MRRDLQERLLFLRSFLTHPRQVGAVLPTSRRTVREMLDMADLPKARCVVEMGAGTGSHTGEILARMAPDARLLAFEIDEQLADQLKRTVSDSRLEVIAESAENISAYLNGQQPDVIVSALPFTSLPSDVGRAILDEARSALAPDGALLVLQYSPLVRPTLQRMFSSVRSRISLLNVPPAFLFACRSPRVPGEQGAA